MKKILTFLLVILTFTSLSQTQVVTTNTLIINHGDIVLYLDNDTTTLVSKHILSYDNFKNIGSVDRADHWFDDTFKGKYKKSAFVHTGYDLGHLTPFHITSYSKTISDYSFSMFNEAPQFAYFNEHPWEQLEMHVEDTISKYKSDAIIITGVIYNETNKKYLPNSKIKIPTHYYKILVINNKIYCWLGINAADKTECIIKPYTIQELNNLFLLNKMVLRIK